MPDTSGAFPAADPKTAEPHPAALEYQALDRRLHDLLERVRKASHNHAQRAVSRPSWAFADDLSQANEHLERAEAALKGRS